MFYAGEPVCYFDTLKTSSLEGAATTVYATGGRGNARLMSWDGERTVTFTMEDALISPEGFMILSGAGLIEPTETNPIYQHMTELVGALAEDKEGAIGAFYADGKLTIKLSKKPYLAGEKDNLMYVMLKKNDEIISEPYIVKQGADAVKEETDSDGNIVYVVEIPADVNYEAPVDDNAYKMCPDSNALKIFDSALVDYYFERTSGVKQINITADSFGGNYYLEASTLFRNQNGVDMPAEFIIPNCRVQSNFTFTMASSGDPSTFTFTLDAFPDYTKFDKTQKVYSAIQIIEEDQEMGGAYRKGTPHDCADAKTDDSSNGEEDSGISTTSYKFNS